MSCTDLRRIADYFSHSTEKAGTPFDVGRTRIEALRFIHEILLDGVVQLWLYEPTGTPPHFRLSYAYANKGIVNYSRSETSSIRTLPTELTSITSVPRGLRDQAITIANEIQPSANHCHERLLRVGNGGTSDAPLTNVIGYLIASTPGDALRQQSNIDQITIVCDYLTIQIERSRLSRLVHLSDCLDSLPTSIASDVDFEGETCKILKDAFGCNIVRVLPVTEGHVDDDEGIRVEFTAGIDNPVRFIQEHADGQRTHAVAVPILADGYELLETGDFLGLNEWITTLKRDRVATKAILISQKRSPYYIGDWFSENEVKQAVLASKVLARRLAFTAHDRDIHEIEAFFEICADTLVMDEDAAVSLVRNYLPDVLDVKIIEMGETLDAKQLVSEDMNSTEHLTSLRDRLSEISVKNPKKSAPKISVLVTRNNPSMLIIHLPTRQTRSRFMALTLRCEVISELHLNILIRFTQEIYLFYRHFDNVRERTGTMAQIRHAIVGSLSSCVRYIAGVDRALERGRRSQEEWLQLQNDPAIKGIKHALFLGNQTYVLAESARLFAKSVTRGDIRLNRKLFPLSCYEEIRLSLDWESDRKRIRWRLRTNFDRKTDVFGDRTLLWMAMYNIMDNALKYAAPNSTVNVTLMTKGDAWRFEVVNSGSFIAEDELDLIFEPFYRGKQVDTLNRRSGTGIGLPATKMVIRAHSDAGIVQCKSLRGTTLSASETTFWFELPIRLSRGN